VTRAEQNGPGAAFWVSWIDWIVIAAHDPLLTAIPFEKRCPQRVAVTMFVRLAVTGPGVQGGVVPPPPDAPPPPLPLPPAPPLESPPPPARAIAIPAPAATAPPMTRPVVPIPPPPPVPTVSAQA